MSHKVGDLVKFKEFYLTGKRRDCPVGLIIGHVYKIRRIDEGIDGAYDWDDVYLEGLKQPFCEFDLVKIKES